MVTLLKTLPVTAVVALLFVQAAPAQEGPTELPSRWTLQGSMGLASIDSPDRTWLEGGLGKLRRDETSPSLALDRLLIDYRAALSATVFAQIDADITGDGDGSFDLTEAFIEWRPVPRSPLRHRVRAGGFYPRLSLENTGIGWSTPHSISFSAINTWIAEEVRLLGAEWSVTRHLGDTGSPHELEGFAAAFYGNDPSGTLLAWKGWGIHDRQTRWREQVPLPPLPQLEPGTRIRENQAPHAEPFLEIDHEPGYNAGLEWRYARRFSIAVSRYDNRADPKSVADGQYGWRTIFDHVAIRAELPWNIGLMVQWMEGSTAMGPVIGAGRRVVDNDFDASYLMLTRAWGTSRIALRFDDFYVYDRDVLPEDDNSESGEAVTIAYLRQLTDTLSLALEWQQVDSTRPARAYLGQSPDSSERMLRAQLRWEISSRPH